MSAGENGAGTTSVGQPRFAFGLLLHRQCYDDVAMLSTSAFESLSQRAERLRRTPWLDVIRNAWLVLLGGIFIKAILPGHLAHSLRPLVLVAPLLVFVAKDLSHLPDAIERTRGILRTRTWRRLPAAWLPPELVGLFRLDRDLRRGFVNWLLRRPQPEAPAGRAFSYLEQGSYRTAVAIVLVSTFVELPISAAVLPLFVHDAGALTLIHLLMLAAVMSTLAWLFGDRWLVGAGRHVLMEEGLQLRVGARTHGLVPLAAIARCERIAEPTASWLRRNGVQPCSAVCASPLDKPNVVLILTPDSRVRLTHLGVERTGLSTIFVYVDRPQDLIAALCCKF
jgi:hypothetical protein